MHESTKILQVSLHEKKIAQGASLYKINPDYTGYQVMPPSGTFKVEPPGPWVFYHALSIIALPQKLKAFFKGNGQTQALQPVAATPLFFRDPGGHYGGFAGLPNYFANFRPMEGLNFTCMLIP